MADPAFATVCHYYISVRITMHICCLLSHLHGIFARIPILKCHACLEVLSVLMATGCTCGPALPGESLTLKGERAILRCARLGLAKGDPRASPPLLPTAVGRVQGRASDGAGRIPALEAEHLLHWAAHRNVTREVQVTAA